MKANSTLQGLVGDGASPPNMRIDPMVSVQGDELPRITYQRIATPPEGSLDGDATIDHARLQIDCWSESYDESNTIADAVNAAMATLTAYRINRFSEYSDETGTHRVSLDFSVWAPLGG